MSNTWLCIPSKRPAAEANQVLQKWKDQGYKIALWRDEWDPSIIADFSITSGAYPGYAQAVNTLMHDRLIEDPECQWLVTGGDDVLPDPDRTAQEIWPLLTRHFGDAGFRSYRNTFGVMQPTGDKWADKDGPYIERVCGSPWIGRTFVERAYGGKGPFWPEYAHMYLDEELQHVAVKLGCFWQRPDLTHFHQHWGRPREGERVGQADRMPDFLKKANSGTEWQHAKRIFEARREAGFPGHEVLL